MASVTAPSASARTSASGSIIEDRKLKSSKIGSLSSSVYGTALPASVRPSTAAMMRAMPPITTQYADQKYDQQSFKFEPNRKQLRLHEANQHLFTNAWPQPCRSRPELSVMSKYKDSQVPRRLIRGYPHQFSSGPADRDVQSEDCSNRSPDLKDCLPDRAKSCRSEADLTDLPSFGQKTGGNLPEPEILNSDKVDSADLRQIFIRSTEGRNVCMQIWKWTNVLDLKKEIQEKLGTPITLQNLLFSGFCLQDQHTLQHYGVTKDSTIILNLRLRGGSKGASSKSTSFGSGTAFRDAVKGKEKAQNKPESPTEQPGPHIVEQARVFAVLRVTIPEVTALHSDLTKNAVICRFNGYWPKSDALHQWIYSHWTPECNIYLCSKGFFIVTFHTEEERNSIINEGPWFWGNAGLFVTPWFADFDANTMKTTTTPVWVRLHNLPLHFWHHLVLTAIGNSLGKFLKIDEERFSRGIFTFARMCVEVDLSQGLPDRVILNYNNTEWTQPLDYENTAYRCRSCKQTGHLQNTCPLVRKNPTGNKKQQKKPNGWQCTEPLEEEDTQPEKIVNQEELDINMEQKGTHEDKVPDPQVEDHSQQQQIPQLEFSGNKRTHGSEGSESDKEPPVNIQENPQAIIVPPPDSGGWRRVEKKKGRKV